MLQTNELRLGNWFEVNGNPEQVIELSNSPDQINGMDSSLIWQASPIPLTPEVLLACGFEKMKKRYYKDEDGYAFGKYFISATWFHRFTAEGAIVLNDSVRYLHQLQNLIHALTGTELTYQIN